MVVIMCVVSRVLKFGVSVELMLVMVKMVSV